MEIQDDKTPVRALNLDANAQKNFIKYYEQLEEKPITTIRIFDRNDFYTCHGPDDTETVSKILYNSTAYIKKMCPPGTTNPLQYLCLSKNNFESVARELLLVRRCRVEIYSKSSGNLTNDWKIEYNGSPGNLLQFEDILFNNNEVIIGSAIIGIQLKQIGNEKKIGLSYAELNDCQFCVTEFVEDDFFSELEAIVVLLGPKECILPSAEDDYAKIKNLMERNGVMVTVRKKNDFHIKQADIVQDLNKLLRFSKGQIEDANSLQEISLEISMGSLAALIKYLNLINDPANLGNYEMKQLNLKRFVHLDAAAVQALNILPKPGTTPSTPGYHWQSILGVLDYCRTPQGHRLIAQWVKQPLRNEAHIKDRLDIVECLLNSPTTLTELHDESLKRIPDIQVLSKKLLRKKATLQDLFRIYQVVIRAPNLITPLLALENPIVKSVICDPFKMNLEDLIGLKQMIEQILDFGMIKNHEYLIKPSFDDDLKEMRERMDIIEAKMDKLLEKTVDDLELEKKSVKLEYVNHLGYHFRISLKDDSALRKNKKYKILDAIKGGVRFTSDKLSSCNTDFVEIKDKYEEQQSSIVSEVIRVALGYLGPLTCMNKFLAEIDCYVSFAIAARSAPTTYVRPIILPEGSGVLNLKNVRHPCLELQESVTYISNDAEFKSDETTLYIITGPNMGGKSTYIRSVGTAVLMAHIGSFVPCDSATITMVDSILGRIGASDNITKGLSTFMVEMIDTSAIIRTATDKSLVIIDELGRGTSTYEGCGIAWAIAEHLAKITRCFTLFATHFHEITELSKTETTVKNCHMAVVANDENFLLLYQVRPGVMEKSFGIQVARMANFPEETIKDAEDMYKVFDDQFLHLKTEEDNKFFNRIDEIVTKLSENAENLDDNELLEIMKNFQKESKELNSDYINAAFPDVMKMEH